MSDGRSIELLLKELTAGRVLDAARKLRPSQVFDPRRELRVYERILRPARLGTPVLYATVADEPSGPYWLLVEHVDGSPLWQIGAFDMWEAAARWLARLHQLSASVVTETHWLPFRYDAAELHRWPPRALAACGASARATVHDIVGRYDQVVELLTAQPNCLVHGEFYASNVLVAGERICPVDWETAGTGAAAFDVAALAAGWDETGRQALVRAYRTACLAPPDEREFTLACEAARLHNAMRWLGLAGKWSPPPEHRTDWLHEASDAAERLGLR